MSPRRGVARRSFARRRIRRIRDKWDPQVIPRRFKVLDLPPPIIRTVELDWELTVLLEVEQRVFDIMDAQGVPNSEWPYYVAFAKKLWNRAVHFGDETFQLEKTSLVNEHTLRGQDPAILAMIQGEVEAMALVKLEIPLPAAWAYDNVPGRIWMYDPQGSNGGYYDNR